MYVFNLISVIQKNENLKKNISGQSELFGILILMQVLHRSTLVFLHNCFVCFSFYPSRKIKRMHQQDAFWGQTPVQEIWLCCHKAQIKLDLSDT